MQRKVIVIILDGCRPDGLTEANAPHMRSLWEGGAYTWRAQSVMPTVTLPAHMSMFRSVTPAKHGVEDNLYDGSADGFPSMVDVAHEFGLHTAMFYTWEELRDLSAPGSLGTSFLRAPRPGEDTDKVVAQAAADYLVRERPDLMVLHIDKIDVVGHAAGWMSPEYLEQVARADAAVGVVLSALETAELRGAYTILLLADHGGHELSHGSDAPEDMWIPWVLNGPGVKQGYELQGAVSICDTAATVAHLLGVALPDEWEGRPIVEALEEVKSIKES